MKLTENQLRQIINTIREQFGEWLQVTDSLPAQAMEFLDGWGWNADESWGNVILAFGRGPDWIIVTDDGGYYKVDAQYMVWTSNWTQAAWSRQHMLKLVDAAKRGVNPPKDPEYQT